PDTQRAPVRSIAPQRDVRENLRDPTHRATQQLSCPTSSRRIPREILRFCHFAAKGCEYSAQTRNGYCGKERPLHAPVASIFTNLSTGCKPAPDPSLPPHVSSSTCAT